MDKEKRDLKKTLEKLTEKDLKHVTGGQISGKAKQLFALASGATIGILGTLWLQWLLKKDQPKPPKAHRFEYIFYPDILVKNIHDLESIVVSQTATDEERREADKRIDSICEEFNHINHTNFMLWVIRQDCLREYENRHVAGQI